MKTELPTTKAFGKQFQTVAQIGAGGIVNRFLTAHFPKLSKKVPQVLMVVVGIILFLSLKGQKWYVKLARDAGMGISLVSFFALLDAYGKQIAANLPESQATSVIGRAKGFAAKGFQQPSLTGARGIRGVLYPSAQPMGRALGNVARIPESQPTALFRQ